MRSVKGLMQSLFLFIFKSILLGVGLAMDAFSVSLANGLNEPKMNRNKMALIASVFSIFQWLMTMIAAMNAMEINAVGAVTMTG